MNRAEKLKELALAFIRKVPIYRMSISRVNNGKLKTLLLAKNYDERIRVSGWYTSINKTMKVSRREYYTMYFNLLNVVLPNKLTVAEIETIVGFLLLEEGVDFKYERFGSRARSSFIKKAKAAGWKLSRQGLNNYIAYLRKKGIIYYDEDKILRLNDNIKNGLEDNHMIINFIFEIKEEEND